MKLIFFVCLVFVGECVAARLVVVVVAVVGGVEIPRCVFM